MNYTDKEIIEHLIKKDEVVTHWFFYVKCRPLLLNIMRSVFNHPVDYDEVVNMIWLLLMENDAKRLKSFGYRCSLCQWLKIVCINHLMNKRTDIIVNEIDKSLYKPGNEDEPVDTLTHHEAEININNLSASMENEREVYIDRVVFFDPGCEKDKTLIRKDFCEAWNDSSGYMVTGSLIEI